MKIGSDFFVSKEIIIKSLDEYGYEANKNFGHLIQSAIRPDNLYSFKILEKILLNFPTNLPLPATDKKHKSDKESGDEYYPEDF